MMKFSTGLFIVGVRPSPIARDHHAKTESPVSGVRKQYLDPYRDFPAFNIIDSPLLGLKNLSMITFHTIHSDSQLITH